MGFSTIFVFIRKNILFTLLLIAIFILKFYSFYPLPIYSIFFATHTIAKALICLIALIFIFRKRKSLHLIYKKNKILFILLSFFVLGQSLSVISAEDIYLFLKFYHNTIISLLIISLGFALYPKAQYTTRILNYFGIIIGIVLIAIELFYFFFPAASYYLISTVIQKEFADAIVSNILQNKSMLALGPEMFVPFFIIPVFDKRTKPIIKFFLFLFVFILLYLSVFSNFRTRILSFIFAFSLSFFIYIKRSKFFKSSKSWSILKTPAIILFLMIVVFQVAISASSSLYSYNIIDRLTLTNKYEDLGPVESRIDQIFNSLYIFTSSPLIGIGLGNYLNYVNLPFVNSYNSNNYREEFVYMSAGRPHNIFVQTLVETGIIGTISFICLLLYFIKKDLYILIHEKREIYIQGYIISSWTVIFYGLFNPADTIYVLGWFWFARGIIEGYTQKSK